MCSRARSRRSTTPPGWRCRPGAAAAAPEQSRRRAIPRRGVLALWSRVFLVLGVGAGVWYINSGQFTRVPALIGKTEKDARQELKTPGWT